MGKKQHYIPRFILQNFIDEDGFIWCLSKKNRKIFHVRPMNIGYENHLYSVGEEKDEYLETYFLRSRQMLFRLSGG